MAGDDNRDTTLRSRRISARGLTYSFGPLRSEGAGNAGRPMRPIAACAGVVVERTRVSQVTPANTRHSPRNGLRLMSYSPRRSGFLVTVAGSVSCQLERQRRGVRTTRFCRPPHAPFVKGTSASIASHPAFVTIAKRPSEWDGMAADMKVICANPEAEYF